MKKLLFLSVLLLALTSCIETKKGDGEAEKDSLAIADRQTIEVGIVGDGTSMHSLEFVSQSGDTLYIVYENNAVGGLACGDLISVEYSEGDEELNAQYIVNLMALCNSWVASDKYGNSYLTLDKNGGASYVGSDFPYKKWTICDGCLYLTKDETTDKFDIVLLTEDSLLLKMDEEESVIPFAKTDHVPVFK